MSAISSTYNGHKPAVNDHTGIDYLYRDTENNAATGEPRRDPFHHRANYHDYGKKDEDREEEKSLTYCENWECSIRKNRAREHSRKINCLTMD